MAKIEFEKGTKESMMNLQKGFQPTEDTQGSKESIAELKATILEQRATLEQMSKELTETKSCLDNALAYSNKMAEEAECASRTKRRFLRNVSHELRTPMNSIIGMIRLLMETELNEEQTEFAEVAHESAKELLRIINDILDLSKIEADSIAIVDEPFDLGDILDNAIETAAFNVRGKLLYLDMDCDSSVPTKLIGDAGRIRQVLNNLLGNAVKFTERGRIDVRVTADSGVNGMTNISFIISDTGVGIPEGADKIIFESFAVGDSSSARRHGGTGLGLAISREIVRAMNGKIGGRNKEQGGAEFFFTIPFRVQEDEFAKWKEIRNLSEKKVIVSIDEIESCKHICNLLEYADMEVVCACSPEEFISKSTNAAAIGNCFDAAILSANMIVELNALYSNGLDNHPAFKNAHFIGVHSPGHRPSTVPTKRKLFSVCIDRPIKQFSFYNVINNLLSIPNPGDRQTRPLSRSSSGGPLSILLVEDHLYSRLATAEILQRMGYQVATASNGLEALEALRENMFDLVLMDIQMPVMDGLSAARAIRAADSGIIDPDVPIIALTAHVYDEDRQLCIKAGMNDYLQKPIESAVLKSTIDSLFGRVGKKSMAQSSP